MHVLIFNGAVVSQCGNVVSNATTYVDTGRECCGVSYYSGSVQDFGGGGVKNENISSL